MHYKVNIYLICILGKQLSNCCHFEVNHVCIYCNILCSYELCPLV